MTTVQAMISAFKGLIQAVPRQDEGSGKEELMPHPAELSCSRSVRLHTSAPASSHPWRRCCMIRWCE